MPWISMRELRLVGDALGHRDLSVYPDPKGSRLFYRGSCACGYVTTRRSLESDAAQALVWHLEQCVKYGTTEHPPLHNPQLLPRPIGPGRRRALMDLTPALTDGLGAGRPAASNSELRHAG